MMKTASVKEIKLELKEKSPKELMEICLTLSKFKKENKELLNYILFEKENEENYIQNVKEESLELFAEVNTKSVYYIKKAVRKILRNIKKYIRYSKLKETEVELLLFFCEELKNIIPNRYESKVLYNIIETQLRIAEKKIAMLHEDLQYDYNTILNDLKLLMSD